MTKLFRSAALAAALVGAPALALALSGGQALSVLNPSTVPTALAAAQVANMNFSASLPANLTYSRSGTMWAYDATGAIAAFAANAPPIPAYRNAGPTNSGIALMPARTNSCLNSTAPATQTISGLSGAFIFTIGPKDTGSMTLSGAATGTVTAGNPVTVSGLSSASVTLTKSGSVSYVGCERTATTATQFAYSSPIVTGASTATRNAETLTGSTTTLGINQARGTIVVVGEMQAASSSNQYIVSLDNGTSGNYLALMYAPATNRLQAQYTSGGTIVATAGLTVSAFPLKFVAAISWTKTSLTVALNGQALTTVAAVTPSAFTTFRVGNNYNSALSCVCFVHQITAYDGATSAQDLKGLTMSASSTLAGAMKLVPNLGQSDSFGSYATPGMLYTDPNWQTAAFGATRIWKPNWLGPVNGAATINPNLIYGPFTGVSAAYTYEVPPGPTGVTTCAGGWGTIDYNCGESPMLSMTAQAVSQGTGENYVIVGASAPGHKCDELGPSPPAGSTTPYRYALNQIRQLAQQSYLSGGSLDIPAAFVNHGQTDAVEGTSYAAFVSCWTSLMATTTSAYKAATGQSAAPIYFFTGINSDGSGIGSKGFPMQQAFFDMALGSSPVSNARLCSPSYMFPLNTAHGPHYSAAGQAMQGEYWGACYAKEFFGGGNWRPLYPTAISASGATVTVTFNVPVGNLAIDNSLPQGAVPYLGLWYGDASGNRITAVSVGTNTVTLTLSGATNASDRYLRAAYNGPVIADDKTMPTVASGGSGGTNGPCVVTAAIDTGVVASAFGSPYGYFQAQYNVTVAGGGISSVNSVAVYGGYPNGDAGGPASDAGVYNSVPVSGCGLTGAALNAVRLRQGFASNSYAGAWSNLRDSSTLVSRTGAHLYNWLMPFNIAF